MSKAKHTTGPWKVEKELAAKSWQWLVAMDAGDRGRGIGIAETLPTIGGGAELANARLIAAAPELLDALKDLVSFMNLAPELAAYDIEAELEDALAAIAKATGAHHD